MTFYTVDSITKIARKDWERIIGKIPEGYGFYKTLEESNLKEFVFHFALIEERGIPVLIAPFFIGNFNLDIGVDGFLKTIITFIRRLLPKFLINRTLFFGSPFGENGTIGIDKTHTSPGTLIDCLISGINKVCAHHKCSLIVFKDFLQKDRQQLSSLPAKHGFFEVKSFPNVNVSLPFASIEEYLKNLGPSTRKNLKRKIKETESHGDIYVEVKTDITGCINEIYQLYNNTLQAGTTHFEKLTPEFFISCSRQTEPDALFFLYYIKGTLSAFNLCFRHNDTLIDKFIGFDYRVTREYNLYYYSWYFNVSWCIAEKIRNYQVGQTDYEPKIRLGGSCIPLYAFLKHRNPSLNSLLKILSTFLKPENFDHYMRKTE